MTNCKHDHLEDAGLFSFYGGEQVKDFARCSNCGAWLERMRGLVPSDAEWEMVEKEKMK